MQPQYTTDPTPKHSKRRANPSGPNAYRWKGGRVVNVHGYVLIRVDGRYVYEHRYVMEQHLGRSLKRYEAVHHRNEDKADNRLENLELMYQNAHNALHTTDDWSKGKRRHKSHNAHLRTGQALACPSCQAEHYEKQSRMQRLYIAYCKTCRHKAQWGW